MKKLITSVVLGALAVAACGGGSGAVAATVDGAEVTVGEVNSYIVTEDGVIDKATFAEYLGYKIRAVILDAAAEADYGLTFTEDEVSAEADRLYESVAGGTQTREEFLAANSITEDFLQLVASQSLLDVALRDEVGTSVAQPTDDEITSARADAKVALTSACVSHILVSDEATAQSVMDRLDAGEDFAALATELSEDTGSAANGGSLGCASPAGYVEPFKEAVLNAPIGEVYPEPVESQFGFHIILVTELTEPTLDEMPTDQELADNLHAQAVIAEINDWFASAAETAFVSVEPEYGTWQPNPAGVVPPTTTE